jgi:predicted MFS family arabinose efflux permease
MIRSLRLVWTHRPSRAVALTFSLVSVFIGSWFARIPEVQAALGLSEATLGLVLLGMPLGTLAVMPLTGWLVPRWGAGPVTFGTSLVQGLPFLFLPLATSAGSLAGLLFAAGALNGALNVAMNARANAVEEARGASILSTCHGFFSLGGMVGAGVGSGAAALSLPLGAHFAILVVGAAAVVGLHHRALTGGPSRRAPGPVVAVPPPALAGPAALLFCVLLAEGAVSNWSAVYLRKGLGASAGVAGLGYAAFSGAMALGRLHGDRLLERVATPRVVRTGAAGAALGLGTGVLLGHPAAGIAGFFVQGLGFAVLVPVLFRAAARTPGLAPGTSIAAVATAGYVGLFTGPPLLGVVADALSLSWAMGVGAALAGLVALGAGPALRRAGAASRSDAPPPTDATAT